MTTSKGTADLYHRYNITGDIVQGFDLINITVLLLNSDIIQVTTLINITVILKQ